jgi:hypothetical protein
MKVNSDTVFLLPDVKSGVVTLQMRVYTSDVTEDPNSYIVFKLRDNGNNDVATMMLSNGGAHPPQWKFRGGFTGAAGRTPFEMRTWYYLRIVLDMDSRVYTCSFGKSLDDMASHREQRAGALPTLQRFSILPRNNPSKVYVDDLVITVAGMTDAAEVDELPPPVPVQIPVEYTDISGHRYESEIRRLAENGFFSGMIKEDIFAPDSDMTRDVFIPALVRLLELDMDISGAPPFSPFDDIDSGDPLFVAVSAAERGGLFKGMVFADNKFIPDTPLSGKECALFLQNASALVIEPGLVDMDSPFYQEPHLTRAQAAAALDQWHRSMNPENRLNSIKFYDRITVQTDTPGDRFSKTGTWRNWVMPWSSHGLSTVEKGAAAIFRPGLSSSHRVNVQVYRFVERPGINTHVPRLGNDPHVRYEISHNGKLTVVHVDWSQGSDGWYSLGVFDFSGLHNEYVKVVRVTDDPSVHTKIGSVRFELYNSVYTHLQLPHEQTGVDAGYSESGSWSDYQPAPGMLEPSDTGNITLSKQVPKIGYAAEVPPRSTVSAGSSAFWRPPHLEPGRYRVQIIRYVDPHHGDPHARFDIFHNGKRDTVFVDFSRGFTGLYDLGTYDFRGTEDEYVKLTRVSSDDKSMTVADIAVFSRSELEGSLIRGITVTAQPYASKSLPVQNTRRDFLRAVKQSERPGYSETGEWAKSTLPSGTIFGAARWSRSAGGSARWNPCIFTQGTYAVYAFLHYHKQEAGTPHFELTHNAEKTPLHADMTTIQPGGEWDGSWIRLGEFPFQGDGGEYLEFTARSGTPAETSRRSDSVLFERKDPAGSFIYSVLVSTHPVFFSKWPEDTDYGNRFYWDTWGHRFEKEVDWMVFNGIMLPENDGHFGVDREMTVKDFADALSKITESQISVQNPDAWITRDAAVSLMYEVYRSLPKSGVVANLQFVPFREAYRAYSDKHTLSETEPYEFAAYFNLLRHTAAARKIEKDKILTRGEAAYILTEFMGNIIHAGPPVTEGLWELTFEDHFTGSEMDWAKWRDPGGSTMSHINSSRWPDYVTVSNGAAHLMHFVEKRNLHNYAAGHLVSRFEQQGGYFEARYKYPRAYATHSSFWDRRAVDGQILEIDANEGVYPNLVAQHLAAGGTTRAGFQTPYNLSHVYHTYAMSWEIGGDVVFYFDGKETARGPFTGGSSPLRAWLSAGITWFDGPMNNASIDGAAMEVDWVKIYKRKN